MTNRDDELDRTVWAYFRQITPEVLAQFFYERGIPAVSCAMCHHVQMSVPKATEEVDGLPITYVHPSKVDTFGLEPRTSLLQYHYRLICKNCGFESRFSVHPVLLWLQEKQKNEDKK